MESLKARARGGRIAHLLEQKSVNCKKTPIYLGAIVLGKRLIRAPSNIIDAKESSEQTVGRIPPSSASVVADAIKRHEMLMVEPDEAVHSGAVFSHVVGLDGAAVVGHCEILDPFLVDGRGFWQSRVAEWVGGGWLFFFGIEVGAGVGVSAGDEGQSVCLCLFWAHRSVAYKTNRFSTSAHPCQWVVAVVLAGPAERKDGNRS